MANPALIDASSRPSTLPLRGASGPKQVHHLVKGCLQACTALLESCDLQLTLNQRLTMLFSHSKEDALDGVEPCGDILPGCTRVPASWWEKQSHGPQRRGLLALRLDGSGNGGSWNLPHAVDQVRLELPLRHPGMHCLPAEAQYSRHVPKAVPVLVPGGVPWQASVVRQEPFPYASRGPTGATACSAPSTALHQFDTWGRDTGAFVAAKRHQAPSGPEQHPRSTPPQAVEPSNDTDVIPLLGGSRPFFGEKGRDLTFQLALPIACPALGSSEQRRRVCPSVLRPSFYSPSTQMQVFAEQLQEMAPPG